MREALMQILSCSNLSVQLLRYQSRSVSTEKSDPVLHALQLAVANVEQTMGFLVCEPASKPQAQIIFAWLCKQDSQAMLAAIRNLFALHNKLAWRTLQFLHKQKLKPEFAKVLCIVVAKGFLLNDSHDHSPTPTTLLARDFVHFLVWKCYDVEGDEQQLVEAFTIAIKREIVWCAHAQQPLLHAALQDLINAQQQQLPSKTVLELVGNRSSAEEEGNHMWDSIIIPALSNATTSKEDVHYNLHLACLLLARNKSRLQSTLPFAIKVLNSPGLLKQTHALAAALVRSVSLQGENSAAVQAALFPLLDDDKDGISSAAIEILVESTLHDPASILHELQARLLGKQSTAKQRDVALEVLTRVLESCPSTASHVAVEEKLVDLLLKQLSDPLQVKHRQLAAKCTARVLLVAEGKWIDSVLPKLCLLLISSAKSAASEAFVLTFSQATTPNLEERLLQVLMMQIGAPYQDEAFALTIKWLALRNDFSALEFVLDACCRNAQTMPQLFAFARRIGMYFYGKQNTNMLTRWYLNLIPRLHQKQECKHVIDRLAPFLLLRVFPSLSLNLLGVEDSSIMVKQLCLAAFSTKDEYPQVKKTAVELLAHIQNSSLPWQLFLTILAEDGTVEKLESIVSGGFPNNELDLSSLRKTALFGCCQCLVSNILQEDFGEDSFPNHITAQVMLQVLDRHATGEEGVAEGVCEYLVLAVICEAFGEWEAQSLPPPATTTTSTVVVEELEEDEKNKHEINTPTLDMVFKLLCDGNHQSFACQVICQVLRCFLNEKSSLAAACLRQANMSEERIQRAGWACCKTIFSKLFTGDGGGVAHRTAFYLVAFTCCFTNMKLAAERSALSVYELTWLVNASLKDLAAVDATAADRIQILRLVGIVLTYPSALLAQLPDGTFGRIQTTLRGIANLDTSAEARTLAGEIAKMFEK